MSTTGGGLSPEGSGSKSFSVPGEQGMYGVPGFSPDTFPSRTSLTSSGTFDKSPVNQANNQRRKVSAPNPTPFTSTQPTLGEEAAPDRQSIKPVPINDDTQAGLVGQSIQNPLSNEHTEPLTEVHPSEIFPWVDKEVYFQERDAFIADNIEEAKKILQSDPDFSLRDNPQLTHDAAALLLRANFVAGLFDGFDPIEASNVELNLAHDGYVNQNIEAFTISEFYHGEELMDLHEIIPTQIDDIELKYIEVGLNIIALENQVREIENFAGFLRKSGKSENVIQELKGLKMEELAIYTEWAMVSEMGHVVYMVNHAQSKEGMRKLIEELKIARKVQLYEPDIPFTEEEKSAYYQSNIEKDGDIWQDAFMQRFYPGISSEDLDPNITIQDLIRGLRA